MRKYIVILGLLFFVFSCKEATKTKTDIAYDRLQIEKKIYAMNDSTKPHMNLTLDFTYPVSGVNDSILGKIQKAFIIAFAGEDFVGQHPKVAFEQLETSITHEAQELAAAFSDSPERFGDCFQKTITSLVDTTESLITVKTESENYMGGAHGAHSIYYYNIDPKTGMLLQEKDIFTNYSKDSVRTMILDALSDKFKADLDNMLFTQDQVQPNANFHLSKEGLVYTFNQYEIAPYSVGIIEVTIPYSKVEGMLKKEYKRSDSMK